jgi:hypothetical protein
MFAHILRKDVEEAKIKRSEIEAKLNRLRKRKKAARDEQPFLLRPQKM